MTQGRIKYNEQFSKFYGGEREMMMMSVLFRL